MMPADADPTRQTTSTQESHQEEHRADDESVCCITQGVDFRFMVKLAEALLSLCIILQNENGLSF